MTAHGITDALRDAESLAIAVASDTPDALARYQFDRDTISSELFAITDQIAGLGWNLPKLQELHQRLNSAMKAQQDWMVYRFGETRSAA